MGAYNNLDVAIAGLKAGLADAYMESWICAEADGISYGDPLFAYDGDANNVYKAHNDTVTISFDINFEASNSAVFTVNGVALSAVVYAVSNANTYNLVKAAIEAGVAGSAVTVDASAKTVIIFTKGKNLTATVVVTGGTNQPVGTPVSSINSTCTFVGFALFIQKSTVGATGGYVQYETVSVLCRGYIYVNSAVSVSANQKAYAVWASGASQGKMTNVSSGNFITKAYFRGNVTGAGLVLVEVLDMSKNA